MVSFAAITVENSQRVLMNDNLGREGVPSEEWICAAGGMALAFCVKCYADKHNIDITEVGFSSRPLKEG